MTIMLSKDDVNTDLHPNLWHDFLESLGVDPEAAMLELELAPGDTNKKDAEKEDGNKTIKVLQHTISYYYDDTDLDIDETGTEHIEQMIGEGYNQGELTVTSPDNPEEVFHGWWSIHNL